MELVLQALAAPRRREILRLLRRRERSAGEIHRALGEVTFGAVSQHLAVLEQAGLVSARRDRVDGRWVYYSVDRANVFRWQAWFSAFFDPSRIRTRQVCGPEGQLVLTGEIPTLGQPC
jgi:ArsR family transcriptional regulator